MTKNRQMNINALVKSFFYNNSGYITYPSIVALILFGIAFLYVDRNDNIVVLTGIVAYLLVGYALLNFIVNVIRHRKCSFLVVWTGIFIKRRAWINMKKFTKAVPDNKCPIEFFARDMREIKNTISKRTMCYTVTHEIIKVRIKRHFKLIDEPVHVYDKNLIVFKQKMHGKKCNTCTDDKCNIRTGGFEKMEALRFKKER